MRNDDDSLRNFTDQYSLKHTTTRLLFVLHDQINFSGVDLLKIKLLELFTVYFSFVKLKGTKTLILRSLLIINE